MNEARFAPVLAALEAARRDKRGQGFLIAIDGGSGAGKSTLAALLRQRCGAAVVHMDDFFLPQALRTPARLAEVGGFFDYARFDAEVTRPLSAPAPRPFAYRVYDCATGSFRGERRIEPDGLVVVEGVYSLSPRIALRYDLSIFLRVAPDAQRARILRRDGPAQLRRYCDEWIPRENAYFAACSVEDRCDIVL